MGKKIASTPDKVQDIPDGMAFAQLRLDLIASPAWHGQSINCRRLIEFLLIEHMHHAGSENGKLLATYDQLVAFGISRKSIQPAIAEAESRGLILVDRGGRKKFAESHLSRFTLTFYRTQRPANDWGQRYWVAPTDEWKRYRARRASEIINQGDEREPNQFPNGNSEGSQTGTVTTGEMAENCHSATVPKQEPLYISWPPTGVGEAVEATCIQDATPAPAVTPTEASPPIEPAEPEQQQPTIAAGRQRRRRQQDDGRDNGTIDIEDLLKVMPNPKLGPAPTSPIDRLRDSLKAKLATAPKGTQKRVADLAHVSPCHMSNFLAGKFGLNPGALAVVRQFTEGGTP